MEFLFLIYFSDDCKDEKEKQETEAQEKTEKKEKEKDKDDSIAQEVAFNIIIQLPAGDSFQIPVSNILKKSFL